MESVDVKTFSFLEKYTPGLKERFLEGWGRGGGSTRPEQSSRWVNISSSPSLQRVIFLLHWAGGGGSTRPEQISRWINISFFPCLRRVNISSSPLGWGGGPPGLNRARAGQYFFFSMSAVSKYFFFSTGLGGGGCTRPEQSSRWINISSFAAPTSRGDRLEQLVLGLEL